jgi:hypothetical protein
VGAVEDLLLLFILLWQLLTALHLYTETNADEDDLAKLERAASNILAT